VNANAFLFNLVSSLVFPHWLFFYNIHSSVRTCNKITDCALRAREVFTVLDIIRLTNSNCFNGEGNEAADEERAARELREADKLKDPLHPANVHRRLWKELMRLLQQASNEQLGKKQEGHGDVLPAHARNLRIAEIKIELGMCVMRVHRIAPLWRCIFCP
jgi:hypothetical protein